MWLHVLVSTEIGILVCMGLCVMGILMMVMLVAGVYVIVVDGGSITLAVVCVVDVSVRVVGTWLYGWCVRVHDYGVVVFMVGVVLVDMDMGVGVTVVVVVIS